MSKILVDVMPKEAKERPFSIDYPELRLTGCQFLPNTYVPHCYLNEGKECRFIVGMRELKVSLESFERGK